MNLNESLHNNNNNLETNIAESIPVRELPYFTYSFAKRHGVLIAGFENQQLTVVNKEELSNTLLLELRRFLKKPFKVRKVSPDEFDTLLTQIYQSDNSAKQMAEGIEEEVDLENLLHELPKTEDLLDKQDDAPIIRLLNAILNQAIKLKASDIHIETYEQKLIVRFRIDGVLQEVLTIQRVLAPMIISRIKVMARLDIAEKRLPQDGRITLRIAGHTIDVRVSTIPANHGERIVLRLLDKKSARLDLTLLGMSAATLTATQNLIAQPNGIILVTGPTGSGKSTTLSAMMMQLNQITRNILTVEDPIEYELPGIGQMQVNTKVDMTFAKGLRAILRQDPDIVMVGEIRDRETAEIAVQASLTGHLVLSTLHTNSALGAITRLRDMGIEPFLLSATLIGTIGQRLIRLLCPYCKTGEAITEVEREFLKMPLDEKDIILYHPQGCNECNQTGYLGRTGIYELIAIDEHLKTLIHENATEHQMENSIRKFTSSMRQDGFRRVLSGETTIEEVIRVTNADMTLNDAV